MAALDSVAVSVRVRIPLVAHFRKLPFNRGGFLFYNLLTIILINVINIM